MNIGERCWLLTDSIADLGELRAAKGRQGGYRVVPGLC